MTDTTIIGQAPSMAAQKNEGKRELQYARCDSDDGCSFYPGKRVFRWTVIAPVARTNARGKWRYRWLCRCDCGVEKHVLQQSLKLALTSSAGGSRSCGCLAVEIATKHGNASLGRPSPEYMCWIAAKKRCVNPSNASYRHYGGRGIRMHPEWASSFEAFLRDMGPRPSAVHSLDRIDPEGNYEPGNCRWVTTDIQARNKRNVRWYAFEGQCLILEELATKLGMPRHQARALEKKGRLPAWQIVGWRDPAIQSSSQLIDFNNTESYRVREAYKCANAVDSQ